MQDILSRGEELTAEQFKEKFDIDRHTLYYISQIYSVLLIIVTAILSAMVWRNLPHIAKRYIFNQYTIAILFISVLVCSIWSENIIAEKSFVKRSTSIFNAIAFIFTIIVLVIYIILLINYYSDFFKI